MAEFDHGVDLAFSVRPDYKEARPMSNDENKGLIGSFIPLFAKDSS